jgi:hypothetical protein
VTTIIVISLAAAALFIASIAAIFAFLAWSTVVGMKNSTHRIQYLPVKDPEFNQFKSSDLEPGLDEEGNRIPVNGGDESTGLGLINAFKNTIHQDEED